MVTMFNFMKFKFKNTQRLWYAVDEDGRGFFFEDEPRRENNYWTNSGNMFDSDTFNFSNEELPNISWENDPVKVKITNTIYW